MNTIEMNRWTRLGGAALLASVLLAPTAHAQEEKSARRDRTCVRECRLDGRECVAPIRDEFRLCREAQCGDQADVVRATCGADRESGECAAARGDLRECLEVCREPLGEAVQACREEAHGCAEDCPDAPSLRDKDRTCVRSCFGELRECAQESAPSDSCRATCRELHEAAADACAVDRGSDDCRAARREARACTRECREASLAELAPCRDAFGDCVQTCPQA